MKKKTKTAYDRMGKKEPGEERGGKVGGWGRIHTRGNGEPSFRPSKMTSLRYLSIISSIL